MQKNKIASSLIISLFLISTALYSQISFAGNDYPTDPLPPNPCPKGFQTTAPFFPNATKFCCEKIPVVKPTPGPSSEAGCCKSHPTFAPNLACAKTNDPATCNKTPACYWDVSCKK